jgi:hypothetical protein
MAPLWVFRGHADHKALDALMLDFSVGRVSAARASWRSPLRGEG